MNRWFDQAWLGSAAAAGLRQRERNRADGQKHKEIKSASHKMRFDGGIKLFFHRGVVVVRILISWVVKLYFETGTAFLPRNAEKCQDFFRNDFEALVTNYELGFGPDIADFLILTDRAAFPD